MTRGEIVYSLRDYSQDFVREYKNPKLDQKVIDAIVVDFINYFACKQCHMNLGMCTSELRNGKKLSEKGSIPQKSEILPILKIQKENYYKFGIIKGVNLNKSMNECEGKAEAHNSEALKVIISFIKGYMNK